MTHSLGVMDTKRLLHSPVAIAMNVDGKFPQVQLLQAHEIGYRNADNVKSKESKIIKKMMAIMKNGDSETN
ncbi:MAG: hypothetical protein KBT10_05370 [Bacteroidales bacterium]|nr:hypothetical protein [Candidatus Sodaliphilus aphodohippi]